MILHELCGRTEDHPIYRQFENANNERQLDFLRALVRTSLVTGRTFLSAHIVKALNFHAITCLHSHAGEYRPCPARVGEHLAPDHTLVESYMDDFINEVNLNWRTAEAMSLGAYVLWRINFIHPFINGNGRTARAAAYFVICLKLDSWLPGTVILPDLLRANREECVDILRRVDASHYDGQVDLEPLQQFLHRLVDEQINSAGPDVVLPPGYRPRLAAETEPTQ